MDYRILCIVALAFWGVWGYLSKVATTTDPPGTFAFWATLASLVPIVAFALATAPKHGLKVTPLMLIAGLCAGVATVAFYLALSKGPASVVLPLTGMYILIPAVLGIVILKEQLTLPRIIGLLFAGLAVVLLSR